MMEQERLPMIQEITACVYFRQENDIIVTCQHRTILEQDILSENFYPPPSGNGKVFAGGKSPCSKT